MFSRLLGIATAISHWPNQVPWPESESKVELTGTSFLREATVAHTKEGLSEDWKVGTQRHGLTL